MQTEEQVQGGENEPLEEQDDFGSAFAEDEVAAKPEDEEDATPTELEPEQTQESEEVTEPEQSEEKKEEPAPQSAEEQVDWRKRAEDNQAAFTKSREELKSLREELEKLKKEHEAKPEKKDEPAVEIPENVKQLYELYPEFKPAIVHEADKLIKQAFGDVDLKQLVEEREKSQTAMQQLIWEREVTGGLIDETGNYIEGHPDFYRMVASKDYNEWLKTKGYDDLCTSKTAIARLGEYKETVLKKAAADHDAKVKAEADKIKEQMAGTLKSKPAPKSHAKKDEGDFGSGFNDD